MPPAARTVGVASSHPLTQGASRACACFQAAGHCAREASAAASSRATSSPGDERGAAVAAVGGVVAQPLPGDHRVLVLAEHLLHLLDGRRRSAWLACRPRARPPRRRTGAAWRGCAPRAARGRAGRRRGRGPPSRSFFHGFAHQIAQLERRSRRRRWTTRHRARRREQAVDQRERSASERIPASSSSRAVAVLGAEDVEQPFARATVGCRAAPRPAARAGRAARRRRAPRRAGRPATSSSSRSELVPSGSSDLAEGPQVGAQPTGRDARLVHVFGVVAEAHARIVGEQPRRRPRRSRRGAPRWASTRSRASAVRHEVGRRRARGGPSARTIFGSVLGLAGARRLAAGRRPRSRRRRDAASTNSTSSSRNRAASRAAVEHGHVVVDELGDWLAVGDRAARQRWRTVSSRAASSSGASREQRLHEVDGGVGRVAGARRRRAARSGRARRRTLPAA